MAPCGWLRRAAKFAAMDEPTRPTRLAALVSAHELMNMIDKGVINIAEARKILLGPDASDYPAAGPTQADDNAVELLRRALDQLTRR